MSSYMHVKRIYRVSEVMKPLNLARVASGSNIFQVGKGGCLVRNISAVMHRDVLQSRALHSERNRARSLFSGSRLLVSFRSYSPRILARITVGLESHDCFQIQSPCAPYNLHKTFVINQRQLHGILY